MFAIITFTRNKFQPSAILDGESFGLPPVLIDGGNRLGETTTAAGGGGIISL